MYSKKNSWNYVDFLTLLETIHGLQPIHKRLIEFIYSDLNILLSEEAKIFIHFYLIRESMGSTLISLDTSTAVDKFTEYYEAQKTLYRKNLGLLFIEKQWNSDLVKDNITEIFRKAQEEIIKGEYKKIILDTNNEEFNINQKIAAPFVMFKSNLFAQKYFTAKLAIEAKIKAIFKKTELSESIADLKKQSKDVAGFELKNKQAEAVSRGENGSLIITGGPGTGKTTVIFFILRALLRKEKNNSESERINKIILAAPSGKAADRLNESINASKAKVKNENLDYNRISTAKTIHRILEYNPKEQIFNYNEDNKLPDHSIIVIDESSMIDINLFSALLKAIPAHTKLFLLGDRNQLPSVDAGAVLGDLLSQMGSNSVMLEESNRFDGILKDTVDKVLEIKESHKQPSFNFKNLDLNLQLKDLLNEGDTKSSKVTFLNHNKEERSILSKEQKLLLDEWFNKFYKKTLNNFEEFFIEAKTPERIFNDNIFSSIFEELHKARILSAERNTRAGTDLINDYFIKKLKTSEDDSFFAGEILMLTKNMHSYEVFNGDIGIVIKEADANKEQILRLVFKKGNEYRKFSLSDFDYSTLIPAYAITIHKSQGSEFDHVLMFLPEEENHPLLSNEIIYTGISRSKLSCIVVTNKKALESGIIKQNKRDSGIEI